MKTLAYKGYIATVEFDVEDRLFVGHLADIPDIVGFHGTTMGECEAAFRETVDHYMRVLSLSAEAKFAERARRGQGKESVGLKLLRKAGGKSSKA